MSNENEEMKVQTYPERHLHEVIADERTESNPVLVLAGEDLE